MWLRTPAAVESKSSRSYRPSSEKALSQNDVAMKNRRVTGKWQLTPSCVTNGSRSLGGFGYKFFALYNGRSPRQDAEGGGKVALHEVAGRQEPAVGVVVG